MGGKRELAQYRFLLNFIIFFTLLFCQVALADTPCTQDEHAYTSEVIRPATESQQGQVRNTCIYCGDTYMEILPFTGHVYGAWEVMEERDGKEQLEHRICTVCNRIDERVAVASMEVLPVQEPSADEAEPLRRNINILDVVLAAAIGCVWGFMAWVTWWNGLVINWYEEECKRRMKELRIYDN